MQTYCDNDGYNYNKGSIIYNIVRGVKLNGYTFEEHQMRSELSCIAKCNSIQTDACRSVNYNAQYKICSLNNFTAISNGDMTVSSNHTSFARC